MKTPIAACIEKHLLTSAERRLTQKELAARLLDRGLDVKLSTLEEKLSKLMNGHRDGERFFDTPDCLRALAEELDTPAGNIKRLLQIPSLVLHPSLPEAAVSYLLDRAISYYGTADWILAVDPAPSGSQRRPDLETVAELQEATNALSRPVLVLVMENALSSNDERALYAVAKLPLGFVTRAPRGYEIIDHPDVLPLPAPTPPKQLDEDGQHLYAVAEMGAQAQALWTARAKPYPHNGPNEWQAFGHALASRDLHAERYSYSATPATNYATSKLVLEERLSSILQSEGIPSFYSNEVLGWLCWRYGSASRAALAPSPPLLVALLTQELTHLWRISTPYGVADTADRPDNETIADAVTHGRVGKTTLWHHAKQWFVFGPEAGILQEQLHAHCPEFDLRVPELGSHLAQLLRENRNPWSETPAWFAEFSRQTLDDCGVSTEGVLNLWRNRAVLAELECHKVYPFEPANASNQIRVREALASIVDRTFRLSEGEMWVAFVLRKALHAPLVAAELNAEHLGWNAVIHLGAGHLVRLRVRHHPHDPEVSIRPITDNAFAAFGLAGLATETHLDGGNIHIQIGRLPHVQLLEGSVSIAARRRQAEDDECERRARESDDDDDE